MRAAPRVPPKKRTFLACSSRLFLRICFCVLRLSIFDGTCIFVLTGFPFSIFPGMNEIRLNRGHCMTVPFDTALMADFDLWPCRPLNGLFGLMDVRWWLGSRYDDFGFAILVPGS